MIEPLEQRIAPALLVVGANLLRAGGPDGTSSGETSVGGNSVTLIKVISGQAIAWFDGDSITSISVGPNTNLDLTGNVGDIVANLTADGRLTDSDNDPSNGEDGGVLLNNNITGITTHPLSSQQGDIRNVITGGSVSNLSISGHLRGVYAGDGAFRDESAAALAGVVTVSTDMDVNPVLPGYQGDFVFAKGAAKTLPGASVQNVSVAIAQQLEIFSGSGNGSAAAPSAAGRAGGSITNIRIGSAFVDPGADQASSYTLIAGDGSDGTIGGAGGSISKITEETSTNFAVLHAGAGGNGGVGAGGAGGSVSDLDVQGDSATYRIDAGKGGSGKIGGAGGSVVNANFAGKTPNTGVIVAADFDGDGEDDILVVDSNTGSMVISKSSSGGALFQQLAQYIDPDSHQPVYKIDGAGSAPSDALAADIDGDGDIDIIVAYKASNNIGVFFNRGDGSFWDGQKKAFDSLSSSLTFSPSSIALGDFVGGSDLDLAVLGVNNGLSVVHASAGNGKGQFTEQKFGASLSGKVADIVTAPRRGGDAVYVGLATGDIYALSPTGVDDFPFSVGGALAHVNGGITNIDMDSAGQHLLATSTSGKSVTIFAAGGGGLSAEASIDLRSAPGRPIVAHFVASSVADAPDSVAVLSVNGTGSRFDLFSQNVDDGAQAGSPEYNQTAQVSVAVPLKNFTPAYQLDDVDHIESFGVAALGGSLNQFVFSEQFGSSSDYALPFSGKKVIIHAGAGGDGNGGKGGAGGNVQAINAFASEIVAVAGDGGSSTGASGGAGGSVLSKTFTTVGRQSVVPVLNAESALTVFAGNGGSALQLGKSATGGAGGSLAGLSLILGEGDMSIRTGSGGAGFGGAGGNGGAATKLNVQSLSGGIALTTGGGGAAKNGRFNGGSGGAVNGLTYALDIAADQETVENSYSIRITTGDGGVALAGAGGAGGAISDVRMKIDAPYQSITDFSVDPPTFNAHVDSTVRVSLKTGHGGDGGTGGAGGSITKATLQSYFDQTGPHNSVLLDYVVLSMDAGDGGMGTLGNGGNGGSILLKGAPAIEGVTFFDEDSPEARGEVASNLIPLVVTAGFGGTGAVKGGLGGSVSGLVVQNARFQDASVIAGTELDGAIIAAGDGGDGRASDGGRGGDVSNLSLGVWSAGLYVYAGSGGDSGIEGGAAKAKGAIGGSILNSTFGSVASSVGLAAGNGGKGIASGGIGGSLSKLKLNTPEIGVETFAELYAGAGGDATGAKGLGGAGGAISGISQSKDINSAIDLIQAGNGGAAPLGTGGKGGSVTGINTVGFLGKPTDGDTTLGVLGEFDRPQGVFVGRGGLGQTGAADAGSVSSVSARQIAAIAAAMDEGTGLFAPALKVAQVKADLIGYDQDRDGVFDSVPATSGSPGAVLPMDGFILAKALQAVTGQRPGFVFNS